MPRLPEKLRKPPVVECIFEVRFVPSKEGAGELLIGLLYSKLGEFERIEALPAANIPHVARDNDPNLRYLYTRQLVRQSTRTLVGDRSAAFSQVGEYGGWGYFRSECIRLLNALSETKLLASAERYSLKFLNVIEIPDSSLAPLDARFELGGSPVVDAFGFRFRTESNSGPFTTVIEIVSGSVTLPGGSSKSGLIASIDSIRMREGADIWNDPGSKLDEVHNVVKEIFFKLLKPETLAKLEPEYS